MRTPYDQLAAVYDEFMGTDRRDVGFVQSLIDEHHPEAFSVLELGCGTGAVLEALRDDYRLSGIDSSKKMLDIARQKCPDAQIQHADIRDFNAGQTYDVILCIFDTINHLLRFREWKKVFANAARHLNDNGVFIFDINTKQRLDHLVQSTGATHQRGSKELKLSVEKDWRKYTFVLDTDNGKISVDENAFSETRIQWQLHKNFSQIRRYETLTEDIDEQMSTSEDIPARVFYVCKK